MTVAVGRISPVRCGGSGGSASPDRAAFRTGMRRARPLAILRRRPFGTPRPNARIMHYLLFYELAPDYLERRKEFRTEHLKLAWEAHERGDLVLAGALAEPADRAVFLFDGSSAEAAEAFAESDPYVRNGIVTDWRVRPWTTVVGEGASSPVLPEG